jgi:LysM repeat protein
MGETPAPRELRPYSTTTASVTAPPHVGLVVTAPAPLPSPTPFLYTVQAGDTLSQIADKFHVSLDAVVSENPDLDPNAMAVGHVLKIPGNPASAAGGPTSTPETLPVQQLVCHSTADGGLWCFALVHNDSDNLIENVTAQVTLDGANGQSIASKSAVLPLDILPPDQSLPLAVFFPPGVPGEAAPRLQILTAMRLLPNDSRYLPATIRDTLARVSWSGLTADLTGEVFLPEESATAKSVWVAAVAYDQDGNVVGLRRWESSASLSPGASLPFSFTISAISGRIERLDYAVEARP